MLPMDILPVNQCLALPYEVISGPFTREHCGTSYFIVCTALLFMIDLLNASYNPTKSALGLVFGACFVLPVTNVFVVTFSWRGGHC